MAYSEINAVGIIPARYNSSRFPGKPLADINGKSMINRVYNQAMRSKLLSQVYIATDDSRIFEHAKTFTDNVLMTSIEHRNGTERIAEAMEILEKDNNNFNIVANIQGDEPYIFPEQIDEALSVIINNPDADIATLVKKIDYKDATDINRVKVVIDNNNKALYFSRQLIPYYKSNGNHKQYLKHIGLYVFKTSILKEIVKLKPSLLEEAESLEQLRWLENGYNIYIGHSDFETISIDTKEDLENISHII